MGSNENGATPALQYIPLTFNHEEPDASALSLVLKARPKWKGAGNKLEIVHLSGGLTNTILKIINRKPGLTEGQVENAALLMRVYGNSGALINREREIATHLFLSQYGLAPPLLARFENGLLCQFVCGKPCEEQDLYSPPVFCAVASHLAHWHAVLPSTGPSWLPSNGHTNTAHSSNDSDLIQIRTKPSIWTVLQDWIDALPVETHTQHSNRLDLQKELQWIVGEFDGKETIGENGLVFSHGDLIPGNIIIRPDDDGFISTNNSKPVKVTFIDYECAISTPAAFEIASHFACWIGNECDYTKIPSKSTRRKFLAAYTKSYCEHRGLNTSAEAEIFERLSDDVDHYRGIPGFYWAVWAFIHSKTSKLDFDSVAYGKQRLEEYYTWKREYDGSRVNAGEEIPFREQRWAREE